MILKDLQLKTVTKLTTLPAKRSLNETSTTTPGDTKHKITISFNSFNSIIDHNYTNVERLQNAGCGTKWRNKFTQAERKIFQRMERVIKAFWMKLLLDNVSSNEEIKEKFETYSTLENKSWVALADAYSKKIIHEWDTTCTKTYKH